MSDSNDIQAAIKRGAPVYEVVGGQSTLDVTPFIAEVKKAAAKSLTCTVFQCQGDQGKVAVFLKTNGKVQLDTLGIGG